MKDGFLKVGAASPKVWLGDPMRNADELAAMARRAADGGIKVLVFPELSLTGYTLGDILGHRATQRLAEEALAKYAADTRDLDMISFVGLPATFLDKTYNCAAAVCRGELLGLVAKENLPNYGGYSEVRYFAPAPPENTTVTYAGFTAPFGNKIIFINQSEPELRIAAELCEDLWVTVPPSSRHAEAGANVIVNLSASGETVGKEERRRDRVRAQSASARAVYIHAEAGEGESTTDGVFAAHNLVASLGRVVAEAKPFARDTLAPGVIDVEQILRERAGTNTFISEAREDYLYVPFSLNVEETEFITPPDLLPFIPRLGGRERCLRILEIQSRALAERFTRSHSKKMVIGLSGGLDSTLAILVCARAMDILGLPHSNIAALTMPCFGTTKRTRSNAEILADLLGCEFKEIDIRSVVTAHLSDIGHDGVTPDVTYENAQARERTQVLMDYANMCSGLVIGTGDLSELVLGWATYNGDHMSSYAVNASIPKTLVRRIVEEVSAASRESGMTELSDVLDGILATPVSPELLPPRDGEIAQCTEELVGPYELHDFFIYYTLRYGFSPRKVLRLAISAAEGRYSPSVILGWLKVFYGRFFSQQFKRSCLPDGPRAGVISVSPRGDLRMPSDAVADAWRRELPEL